MKVPVNPQTRVPTGQLGYEQPVDVTAGGRALAQVVEKYAQSTAEDEKKRELFDVQRRLVDETNNIQTDFEAKTKVQPLGAPNFTQQVNGEYNTRHQQLVKEVKDLGYSTDVVQEFATRLGTIRSQYVAKAIDFQDKSNYSKVVSDSSQLAISLSQYANKNPNAVGSSLDEFRVALTNSGLTQPEQLAIYEDQKKLILQGAREGFATQHPEALMQLFDPSHVISSTVNAPDGSTLPIETQPIKPNGTLADNIVAGLKNRGLPDHLARGIAAGIASESANKIDASNAGGGGEGAHYLGQWRGSRLKAIRAKYGNNPTGAQQLDFLVSELHGGDPGGKTVLSQTDEIAALHSYIHDFMRPSEAGEKGDISRGLAALGRKVAAHASATEATLRQPVLGKSYNQEDAIQELGMTPDEAKLFATTGKDTRQAVGRQLAPGNIDVSMLPAVSNPDGSVSTVRSITIEQDGKAYLIPTVIDGKVVSNDEAIASFHETGKNLGTFTNEAAADAYAQQLHESEARRVTAAQLVDGTGKTGIPVIDLSSGPERMQMLTLARTIYNEHKADITAAQRAAHATYYNDFLNNLQDGKLGQTDLDTAYQTGQITDYDERKKAQNILDEKNKKDDDLARFGAMLHSGQKFNPYDNDAQKAADAGFIRAVKETIKSGENASPFMIGLRIWQRTGILPKQSGVMIRGGLIGTDPAQVAESASVASNMIQQNPNAFAGVDGGEDIGKAAATYTHYVDDLGMSAQEAANKIAQMNSPEFKAKEKFDEPTRNAFINTITGDKMHDPIDISKVLNDGVFGKRGWGSTLTFHAFDPTRGTFTDAQKAEASQTYLEIALDHYDKYHDPVAAQDYAARQMSRFYGVDGNRLIKYPASKAYPEIQGSQDYVLNQAKEEVDKFAGFPVPKEDIYLQPTTSGSTAAAFRANKPAPYEIHFVTHQDGQTIYHYIPGKVFIADVDRARQEAAKQAREVEKNVRKSLGGLRAFTG